MSKIVVCGKQQIFGNIRVQGSKNSILPILAATLVAKGDNVLHNCAELSDVTHSAEILRALGADVECFGDILRIDTGEADGFCISQELMREMRSSILFLGAMLARNGKAVLCSPGGCNLGPRPIDLHIMALRKLGAIIEEENGAIYAAVNGRLQGNEISFPFVSVGATENTLIAASTAKGTTLIHNAACEPEITDLIRYLNKCGAKISGIGTSNLRVEGVDELHGCEHSIIPDRIVAATYLCAAAVTGGKIRLERMEPSHIRPIIKKLEEAGCVFSIAHGMVSMSAPKRLQAMPLIHTEPYPGFPTDAQALLMAAATVAEGTTVFYESIFQDRFRHAKELNKMGADISVNKLHATVNGVEGLYGTAVKATDLRGGAAVIIAALAAEGKTEISDIHHIERGYENIERNFAKLGAEVLRCEEWKSMKIAVEGR